MKKIAGFSARARGSVSINGGYGRMVREIVRDVFFLGQKSEPATKQDISVGQDLMDTLKANRDRCVGMAANMIGVKKKIIIVNIGLMNIVMYNPVILKKDTPYETEEEKGYAVRDGGRLPFTGWHEKDGPLSEHRSRIHGRQLEETSSEIFRLDGADHTA